MSIDPNIVMENLSENQQEIAELIGMDCYLKLVRRYGGNLLYIQKYTELLRPNRDKEILEKFNGYNYSELAAEYDLSTRTIYKLVSHVIQQKKNAPLREQISWEEYNAQRSVSD